MNLLLLLVLVIAAGAVLSVQAAINGRLGQTVGVLRSSLLTFMAPAVLIAPYGLVKPEFKIATSQTTFTARCKTSCCLLLLG